MNGALVTSASWRIRLSSSSLRFLAARLSCCASIIELRNMSKIPNTSSGCAVDGSSPNVPITFSN